MEYLPLKNFRHADGLSRLISKFKKPFEETVITFLISENQIKSVLCNKIRELLVIVEGIKIQSKKKMIDVKLRWKELKNKPGVTENKSFSICDEVFMYAERVVIPSLQKCILKQFYFGNSGMSRMKNYHL